MIIRFTPEADAELAEARQWYTHQRADLDIEFIEKDRRRAFANRSQSATVSHRLQNSQARDCAALSVRCVL